MRWLAALLSLGMPAVPAAASDCSDVTHDGRAYTICEVDTTREELRLFLEGPDGKPYGQFRAVDGALEAEDRSLGFAMNAGMYHENRAPVGLYLEEGREAMRLVTNPGPGNFGLLPNGVFCIRPDGRAQVFETLAYEAEAPDCRYASQSGPMLVIDGELHPRFLEDSTSRHVRNGVGTSADGSRAVFVMSSDAVTFHEFGRFFRDYLELPQALYFDGNVSRLYAPAIGRYDSGKMMGPIVGTVVPRD